jgi:hypothetical protein
MADSIWNDPGLEPKRAYRWLLRFGAASDAVPEYICKKVDKPSFSISEQEHVFLNHKFWYPGRVEWNEIKVTIVDPLAFDAANKLQQIIADSGYLIPDELDAGLSASKLTTVSKAKAVEQVGRVVIQQIDANGDAVSQFELHNTWIKEVNYGTLSYEEDGLVEIELTLRYDWARQEHLG